jgi:hypothetical protein
LKWPGQTYFRLRQNAFSDDGQTEMAKAGGNEKLYAILCCSAFFMAGSQVARNTAIRSQMQPGLQPAKRINPGATPPIAATASEPAVQCPGIPASGGQVD